MSGNKFGFICYDCSVSTDVDIHRANGLCIDDKKLFVKRASFEQESKSKINVYGNDTDVSRNFDGHLENNFSKKTSNSGAPSAFNLKGAFTGNGKSFARVVKGDTNDRVAKGRDAKTLNFEPVGNDWLNRSTVAKLHKLIATEDLEIEFRNQKVEGSLVRAMGAASLERIVGVKCFGVPLRLWCLNTCKKIGEIWGEFISIDEDTTDMTSFVNGRVLIATKKDFIDEWINIQANNREYRGRVQEEPYVRKLQLSRIADQILDFSVEVENNEVEASNASLANKCDLSSGIGSTQVGVVDLN
ncbi:hypothetical protein Vadar_031428 [Vaccinium darrowii]|uniref:Uncharacterized protein n=1 Tax=Vaccinium darrowii TaxID=229202 RepID=A0ACB7Y9U1_9ERIC|nr:hypothetical protein Vadar_031428 [Vaccinium darrowii]